MTSETSPQPSTVRRPKAPTARNLADSFCIAGIGASAGGLAPICEFFEAMPGDGGIAFVVVQHLSSDQKSQAAEIIGRHAKMPVQQAGEGMQLKPGHIYTIPADTYPSIHGGRLHLGVPENRRGPHLPIDRFFSSLGDDQHERAIGIVLSGCGGDGSQGLENIVRNGGIVVAQAPETCEFDDMPRNAIATGCVTHVQAVGEMPANLLAHARQVAESAPRRRETAREDSAAIGEILGAIKSLRGYSFGGYKRNTLLRRTRRRMELRSLPSFESYVALLKRDAREVEALFKDLLIGVTEFFRDAEAWRLVASDIVAPLVEAKAEGEPIRVWVAGCSTGEEAYSIAILLMERLRETEKHCAVQIFATDTNEDALEHGRRGRYPASIAEQVPDELRRRYFVEDHAGGHYLVTRKLRDALVFGKQNLLHDPPFSGIDLICCRNLLIYLDRESQDKVIATFHYSLHPGGYLFLGNAETIGHYDDAFKPLSNKWRMFRHAGKLTASRLQSMFRDNREAPAPPMPATANGDALLPSRLASLTQQLILERFTPAAVLINAGFETLYYSGPTENYLQMPRGTPTNDLLAHIRDGLRSRLRSAVREAIERNACVVVDNARVWRGGTFEPVKFSVAPADSGDEDIDHQLFLVVFEEMPRAPLRDADDHIVGQLESELQATREDLQSTIEQLETSNERLKISNEEIVSINEELHSINGELEKSKSELQSLNGELKLVNRQLQGKVRELESSHASIRCVLASSEIASICIGRDYLIKWFTPGMSAIFPIREADIGRSLTDFSADNFGVALVDEIRAVLDTLTPKQRELRAPNGNWFLRRTLPFRSEGEQVDGVVINYIDISEAKERAESIASAQRSMAESLEKQVRERTAQLRTLMAELTLTEERERRILAQDLHDGLGQALAIVKIKLTSLEDSERRGALKLALKEIEELIDQSNRSVRSLMQQLNPPVLETLGLIPALEWLTEEMERSYGLAVRIDVEGKPPTLKEPARTTTFRVMRELLINVAKHAGTNFAEINCQHSDEGQLTISVTDQGKGFDYEEARDNGRIESRFGLLSARDRIEFIGGRMNVDTKPGYGTTISISFPEESMENLPEGKT